MTDNIITRLNQASERIGAVGKTERNKAQGWNFRGIDAVIKAVHPVFADLGIVVLPGLESVEYETVEIGHKRTLTQVCRVVYTYKFVEAGGSELSVSVAAEAMDSGDKAAQKAASVCLRTCLLQVLLLPTDTPDPDHDVYEERSQARGPDEITELITAATTKEELRAVYSDAKRLGLLGALNEQLDGIG